MEDAGISHFIGLHFVLCRYFIFLQIEGLWQTTPSKSIGTIFPTAFAHLIFLCHSLVILTTVWEIVKYREACHTADHKVTKSETCLINGATTTHQC